MKVEYNLALKKNRSYVLPTSQLEYLTMEILNLKYYSYSNILCAINVKKSTCFTLFPYITIN